MQTDPSLRLRACVWITHIVTWSGPAHRSQASMRGAATRGRKTALGGLRCGDPPGVTMWVIHTLALNEVNGVTRVPCHAERSEASRLRACPERSEWGDKSTLS